MRGRASFRLEQRPRVLYLPGKEFNHAHHTRPKLKEMLFRAARG
jgi:hypothetical protein